MTYIKDKWNENNEVLNGDWAKNFISDGNDVLRAPEKHMKLQKEATEKDYRYTQKKLKSFLILNPVK